MTCAICGARIERAVLYGGRPVCGLCEDIAAADAAARKGDIEVGEDDVVREVTRQIEERRSEAMRRSQGVLL